MSHSVMTEERRTEIALFRYTLILPLLREPSAQARQQMRRNIAAVVYDLPHSDRRQVSVATLRRWESRYKTGGFEALKPALGGLKPVGPPQTERKAWIANGASVFGTKLFLTDETRFVSAFVLVDAAGPRWAPLQGEDGKTVPAAFLQGTTAATTRKVSKRDIGGKPTIVVEKGSLDLSRPEAGYQWKVEAYAWNGKAFVFDKAVSAKLTQEKKSEM